MLHFTCAAHCDSVFHSVFCCVIIYKFIVSVSFESLFDLAASFKLQRIENEQILQVRFPG